jgi:hypothetical protein
MTTKFVEKPVWVSAVLLKRYFPAQWTVELISWRPVILWNASNVDEQYRTILMNNGIIRVNRSSNCAYRILRWSLKTSNILWFSYENKHNREIKFTIKHLHHSYQPLNIIHSPNDQGLKSMNANETGKLLTYYLFFHIIETDIKYSAFNNFQGSCHCWIN